MTYQGIRGEFNEWEIAIKDGVLASNDMTLAAVRVVTDGRDAFVSKKVFEMTGLLCCEDTGSPLLVRHIHGEPNSIKVILRTWIPQYKGLGLFLEQKAAEHRQLG
ncbi:hypothetical protein DFS34DRAFT_598343 [Phlyctochytrium arcticum]|nr:hypothetical protein DFS34DRAFT_598539 [Phlyctochytrium arcticum]KAI9088502.1 hypothetical protein DFS34DRAFT_598343 [Phlyctochytrium arcticum]